MLLQQNSLCPALLAESDPSAPFGIRENIWSAVPSAPAWGQFGHPCKGPNHAVYGLVFLSLSKLRIMEGTACRQQRVVGRYREGGINYLCKVCSEAKGYCLALDKMSVKILASDA